MSGPTVCRRWIHLAHDPEKRTKFIKSLFKKIRRDFCSSCTRGNSAFLQNNLKLRSMFKCFERSSERVIKNTSLASYRFILRSEMQSSSVITLISLRDTSRHRQGSPRWPSSNGTRRAQQPVPGSAGVLPAVVCLMQILQQDQYHVIGRHTALQVTSPQDIIKPIDGRCQGAITAWRQMAGGAPEGEALII